MKRIVVDASVVAKWYLPEVYGQQALLLLDPSFRLLAPDLLYSEIGNLLWKRVIRKDLDQNKGLEILTALESVPFQIGESKSLMPIAFDIACQTQRTLYGSLYLALGLTTKSPFVTADLKLFNALKKGPFGNLLIWIGDLK
jgi:predicted nucleic acid-binding protein